MGGDVSMRDGQIGQKRLERLSAGWWVYIYFFFCFGYGGPICVGNVCSLAGDG